MFFLRKHSYRRIFITALYSFYLIFLIACVDIIYARLFEKIPFSEQYVMLQMAYPVIHRISDIEGLFYDLRPDSSDDVFRINSFGMRDREVQVKKDRYRIIVMGDSVTFGRKDIKREGMFPAVAERILNDSGPRVQILNAGVSGYNTRQEFIALKEKYLKLKPDMVIFAFCVNDLIEFCIQYTPEDYAQKKILKEPLNPEEIVMKRGGYVNLTPEQYLSIALPRQIPVPYSLDREFILHSSIYRFISIELLKGKCLVEDPQYLPNFMNTYDFDRTLKDIKKLSSDNNFSVRFLILLIGEGVKWNREFIFSSFARNNIEYLDLNPDIKKAMQNGLKAFDDIDDLHPIAEGHRAIGELLAEKLKDIDFTNYLK